MHFQYFTKLIDYLKTFMLFIANYFLLQRLKDQPFSHECYCDCVGHGMAFGQIYQCQGNGTHIALKGEVMLPCTDFKELVVMLQLFDQLKCFNFWSLLEDSKWISNVNLNQANFYCFVVIQRQYFNQTKFQVKLLTFSLDY